MIRRSSSVGSCEAPSMAAASCVRPASFASRTICMTALASPVSASFISFCTSASNLVTFRCRVRCGSRPLLEDVLDDGLQPLLPLLLASRIAGNPLFELGVDRGLAVADRVSLLSTAILNSWVSSRAGGSERSLLRLLKFGPGFYLIAIASSVLPVQRRRPRLLGSVSAR